MIDLNKETNMAKITSKEKTMLQHEKKKKNTENI